MPLTRPKASQIDFSVTNISDPLIRLNSAESGSADKDTGIVMERGSDGNVALIYDESEDQFALINTNETGTTSGNITISSYADLTLKRITQSEQQYTTSNMMKFNQYYLGNAIGSYLDPNEYQKVLTITPASDNENYQVSGRIMAQNAGDIHIVYFTAALRSGTRPDLSWSVTYSEEYNGSRYIDPQLWTKESTTAGFIIAFKGLIRIFGTVTVDIDVIPRSASLKSNVVMNTAESSEQTTIDTGFTANDMTKVSTLASTNLTIAGSLTASSLVYPTSDGTANQVIQTDGSGTLSFADVADASGGVFTAESDGASLTDTTTGSAAGPVITLTRNASDTAADGNYLGQLKFKGDNDAGSSQVFAKITGKIDDASDGTEDGLLEFANKKAGSNVITARLTSTELKLINGTGLEVAGLTYPTADGSANQILKTNGSGALSFTDAASAATVSTTAPSSPAQGDMWFNSSASTVSGIGSKAMAVYDGNEWLTMSNKFEASGGSVTFDGDYRVHTFTSSGNFIVPSSHSFEILIVAGGGGGGLHSGGGGGAGGLLYYGAETPKTPNGAAQTLSAATYTVTIGAGGAGSGGQYQAVAGNGANGANSVFNSLTAIGGGGGGTAGGSVPIVGSNGGSGGGGSRDRAGGSGTSGQGFGGGYMGSVTSLYPGGGGGGAGAAGTNGTSSLAGNGGVGLQYSISGTATYYAGGGGGNLQGSSTAVPPNGTGGAGGGGNGANTGDGIAGTPNTGGGGGGNRYNTTGGGAGGSGVVIVRYLT